MGSARAQAFMRFYDSVTSLGLFRVKRKKEKTIWSKQIKMMSGNLGSCSTSSSHLLCNLVCNSPGPSVFVFFLSLFGWVVGLVL